MDEDNINIQDIQGRLSFSEENRCGLRILLLKLNSYLILMISRHYVNTIICNCHQHKSQGKYSDRNENVKGCDHHTQLASHMVAKALTTRFVVTSSAYLK